MSQFFFVFNRNEFFGSNVALSDFPDEQQDGLLPQPWQRAHGQGLPLQGQAPEQQLISLKSSQK